MPSVSFKPTQDTLKNLKEALEISSPSDLERDGTIQRFEYCYELVWKLAQRVLKDNEIETDTSKSVFRELGRLGWIANVEMWIDFQKMRNETGHEYGEQLAKKSYHLAQIFLPMASELVQILKTKNQV